MRVARVDRWRVQMDASIKTDERGFARIWGRVIGAGDVLEYGPMDGHEDGHLEFIPESTVFDDAAMASLKNSPITFLHPVEPVNSRNVSRVSVGHIIDVKRDGDDLMALHQVEDARALSEIAGGVIELSPGYTTELVDPDGLVVDGRTISAIQTNRVYNHQAIVPEARAGHNNALTIDARILPADGLRIQRSPVMFKIKIDGKTVEVDADTLAKIQALTGGLGGKSDEGDDEDEDKPDFDEDGKKSDDDAEDDKGDAEAAGGAPEDAAKDAAAKGEPATPATDGKLDAAAIAAAVTKSVLESLRKDNADSRAANARTTGIVHAARDALPLSYQFDGKSDDQIMRKAIEEHDPDLVSKSKGLRGDALFGFFTATLATSTVGARSDGKVIAAAKDSYADAMEFRRTRIDAIGQSGFTGDSAVRCEPALKLIFGGKA